MPFVFVWLHISLYVMSVGGFPVPLRCVKASVITRLQLAAIERSRLTLSEMVGTTLVPQICQMPNQTVDPSVALHFGVSPSFHAGQKDDPGSDCANLGTNAKTTSALSARKGSFVNCFEPDECASGSFLTEYCDGTDTGLYAATRCRRLIRLATTI